MKIAYLHNSKLPSRTANSVHVMKMCHAISDIGHEIYLIGPTIKDKKNQDVYDFYNVKSTFEIIEINNPSLRVIGNLTNSFLSVKKSIDIDLDLIYTRDVITAYIASLKGLPTVFESHIPIPFSIWGGIKNIVFKRLLKAEEFLQLVVISEAIKDYYLDNYNIQPEEITLARDGSDLVDLNTTSVKYSNNRSLQVGYVGNLYEGRGKNIIAQLLKECNFAHFHIIGGDEEDIKEWKKEFDSDNTTFHGFIPQSDLDKYRLGFDVLLAPYQKDLETSAGQNTVKWMSPLKIFEYMATGKPIIASDLPAIREILTDGEDALLCDPKKTDEWVKSLEELRDSKLRDELGENALKDFMEKYTWKKRAEKITDAVEKELK